ncbi:acyltransferase family protein [Actinoplanes ianthinogenes]|uniref:acyltransferase family protein n=1 Tax=Actinoplanes ianthinogenes TaxID=122358 RepID=UPI001E5781BE|nr:acyltransferase [Actinoplanes ianthinogenes]
MTPKIGSARRLAALDGLRILAALVVALYHYTGYPTGVRQSWGAPPETAWPLLHHLGRYGWLGVELFFVISGFVICMSSWGRTPGAFFRSRVTRLFPAYWPAVLITTAVLTLWPVVRAPRHWHEVALNLTMMQKAVDVQHVDAVYWSLWREALFYLLFAVVVWRGLTLRRAVIFGYGWLVASMLSVKSGVHLLSTVLQPDCAPFFVAGIALYLIHRFGPDLLLWGLLGASFLLAQYWTVQQVGDKREVDPGLSTAVGAVVVTGIFAVMLAIALGYTARIQWRWLTTAGLLTYPFYLLHEYLGWTMIYGLRDLLPRPVLLPLVVGAMLLAAYLLHRVVEKPLARILKKHLDAAATTINRGDRYAAPAPVAALEADTVLLPTVK